MRFKRVGTGYKCSCRPTDKYFQERVGISLTRNKDKATSDLLVKVSPGTKPWMTLSPTSASCHALRCVVLQQLSRHETTPGCRAGFVAPVAARTTALCGAFAFAPGGLAAAPAAGLRGDAFALASGGGRHRPCWRRHLRPHATRRRPCCGPVRRQHRLVDHGFHRPRRLQPDEEAYGGSS